MKIKIIIVLLLLGAIAVFCYAQPRGIAPLIMRFLELTDVDEATYVGEAGKYIKVNAGETGVEFGTPAGAGDFMADGSVPMTDALDMFDAAAPTTNVTGEIALDTTIVDHQPLFQYYDGGENMTIIAIDTAQLPALDNEIIKYDAGADKFVLEADAGGGGNDVYIEEGDAARVDTTGADLYIDFDDTDFGVGVVGNEGNITITDDGHAHTGVSVSGIAWDDISDSDAATTTSMASNDHTFSNVNDYTWTSGTSSKPDLVIINTNDDATGSSLTLRKAGSTPTPADDDYLGTINYEGDDSAGNNTVYVRLIGQSTEIDDGDEAGEYHIMVLFDDGTPALDEMFSIYGDITGPGTGKFIWNHDSQDMDYQMETDDEDHFLYIDGGANWMRIGDWDTNYVQTTSAGIVTFAGTGDIDLPDDSVDDDDINWADLTYLTTNGAGIDEAFGAGWNADVGPAEKDDIYDILHAYDTDDDGKIDTLDTDSVDVDALDQTISPTLTGRWTFAGEDTGTDVIGLNVNWAGTDPINGQSSGDFWYDSSLNVYKGYTTHEIILGSAEEPGIIQAKKGSGGTISAGDAVYISGFDGTDLLIEFADADDSSKMPAIGIASATINSGTPGSVTTFGLLEDIINTGGMSVGDGIWITVTGTTGNTLTNTKPTGATTAIQRIATVASSAASGELFIAGALRTNDESNLTEAYIFVGNSSQNSTAVAMSGDVAIIANGTTAIQTNAVALTTDTTGNYSNGNAEAGDALVSIAVEITDNENTAENNPIVFVAGAAQTGGDLGLESDGTFFYTPSTGTVTTTEFVGGGSGLTLASTDLTDTADLLYETELDDLSELTAQIGDVSTFITDDIMPDAGTDPDVDAAGELSIDTNGGNEPNSVTLRTFMGTDDQAVLADTLKHYCFSVAEPDNLAQADFHPVWKNKTGFTFIITYIFGESDIDDFDFTLKERDADGANVTTIEAVQLTTDGTAMYYGSVVFADIDHTAIEAGHTLGYDKSADDATYVLVGFGGYYNADVN